MKLKAFTTAALLGLLLGLAACGVKGDPIRPGSEEDPQKQESGY